MSNLIIYITITCIFMLFDIVSGVTKAVKNHELSSTKAREGLYHKFGFLLLLILAAFLNYAQAYINLGISVPLLEATSIYICCTELISTLENLCIISPELCGFLDKFISKKSDDENKQ